MYQPYQLQEREKSYLDGRQNLTKVRVLSIFYQMWSLSFCLAHNMLLTLNFLVDLHTRFSLN